MEPGLVEVDRLEEFAGRYPGWAALVAAQYRRSTLLERSGAARDMLQAAERLMGRAPGGLAIGVMVMGLYPAPFTDTMQVSVSDLLQHVSISKLPQ